MSFKSEDRGSTYYISIPPHWLFPITDYIYRKHTFIDTYIHAFLHVTSAYKYIQYINSFWKSNCIVVRTKIYIFRLLVLHFYFPFIREFYFYLVHLNFLLQFYFPFDRILLLSIICRCWIQFVEVSVFLELC